VAKHNSSNAVLLIGAGRMGGALLKGWIAGKRFSEIHVIEPSPSAEITALAAKKAIALESSLQNLPMLAAVVLAMKPQVLKKERDLLTTLGMSGALVLSIAAGVTTSFLSAAAGSSTRIVRAMPNTPGAIEKGITALYTRAKLSAADRALTEALMTALGEILWLDDEALMDVVTAVSGSGPAYVFLLVETLAAAGRAQGLDGATADRLARATVSGAGALLDIDARPAEDLRREVSSPGGTTEAALKVLMASDGLESLMLRAVDAATKRGKELGE
jgi:pyrroline-5-carboxylate reductase